MKILKTILKYIISGWLVYYSITDNDNKVVLTFDDGPHPDNTEKIIEILKQEDVKAIFFMSGKEIEKYPDLVKSAHNAGHVIANHGYNHVRIDNINFDDEVNKTNKIIKEITGKSCDLFRPPYGVVNIRTLLLSKQKAIKVVLWSKDSGDFEEKSLKAMEKNLRNIQSGDIILFHEDYSHTVDALSQIIKNIKNKGFRFITKI